MNTLIIGTGNKTDLLLTLIHQDIPNVTVIDTVGEIAEALADTIPKGHINDVLYFDPSDTEHVASFNVFAHVSDRAKLVQDLCAFFNSLFPAGADTLTKQNSTFVLANVLTILLDSKQVTFLSVLKFLSDTSYRKRVFKTSTNPIALMNWSAIETWDKADRKHAFAQIQAKIGTLLLSPLMLRTLQEVTGSFYPTKASILIANLSRQSIGDDAAKLLGTLLISRAATPVYIPDYSFLASDYLTSLFSFGGYTVCINSLADVPHNIAQTLLSFTNKYVFPVSLDDAKVLQPYLSGVENPKVLLDPSPEEFLPKTKLKYFHGGRFLDVQKRTIARHTRPATLP